MTGLQPAGFPHSDIMGSMPACGSPMLFAACHVLLRRLVPWHPPCALVRLIFLRMTFVIVDPETNCLISSGKLLPNLATGLQRLFLVFLSMCGCQGACGISSAQGRTLKTIQILRMTVISFFATHGCSFPTSFDVIDLWMKPSLSIRFAP